jgi:D-alanine-D-alanine ligase
VDALRSVGAYVELFAGELPLLEALASGRLHGINRRIKLVYNGIEGGIGVGAFQPGRKALLPAIADAYGMLCSNSNAYACAVGRHKFHYYTLLQALGLPIPDVWHYAIEQGWAGGLAPRPGQTVIAKSTFESWSVGVKEDSVFVVDEGTEDKVRTIAEEIGQPATVQIFMPGAEVCVPVYATPHLLVTPPVEAVLAKAPHDPLAIMTIDDNLSAQGVDHQRFSAAGDVIRELEDLAARVFVALELTAFARIDFRVDSEDRCWVIDVGVSPGVSRESSAFHSASLLGLDHPSFLRAVIGATLLANGIA